MERRRGPDESPRPTDAPQDTKGNTALHVAAANGAPPEAVHMVLQKGADPNRKQFYGNTSVHLAAGSSSPRASEVLGVLFEFGGDPNKRNNAENTPLHVAVSVKAPPDVFAKLVEKGADPGKKVKGKTVTEAAALANLPKEVIGILSSPRNAS